MAMPRVGATASNVNRPSFARPSGTSVLTKLQYLGLGPIRMRLRLPSSRGSFRVRLSLFDTGWAIASPLLAVHFRDASILSYEGLSPAFTYCALSIVLSLVTFLAFRIQFPRKPWIACWRDAVATIGSTGSTRNGRRCSSS
jgi:hypothetical protein